ncbi:Zinc finger protein CONSTANS-LIKE 4 [Glycine soja]
MIMYSAGYTGPWTIVESNMCRFDSNINVKALMLSLETTPSGHLSHDPRLIYFFAPLLSTATLYCRIDTTFLCGTCDSKVHAANKLVSRHPRVALCEVCKQASTHVTCKAGAAALCLTCDSEIHSTNPLASRHERIPITLFFEYVHSVKASSSINFHHCFFSDTDADVSTKEAEVASWLLNNLKTYLNSSQYLFSEKFRHRRWRHSSVEQLQAVHLRAPNFFLHSYFSRSRTFGV